MSAPDDRAQRLRHLLSGLHSRHQLPHLKAEGGTYFVTFRLAGTLPSEVLRELKAERERIVENASRAGRPLTWPERRRMFEWYSGRVDAYLDAGHSRCWLAQTRVAELVTGALRFFEGKRYALHAWVVMPNHVHVVVGPADGHVLSDILFSWKSYTSTMANRQLDRIGRKFWQVESYDHLIRDDEDLARCCAYTEFNPVIAGLCKQPEDWRWSRGYRGRSGGAGAEP